MALAQGHVLCVDMSTMHGRVYYSLSAGRRDKCLVNSQGTSPQTHVCWTPPAYRSLRHVRVDVFLAGCLHALLPCQHK